ncbi:hypothetical protein V8C86DRAFT_3169138 [Haematococcus lacustris]
MQATALLQLGSLRSLSLPLVFELDQDSSQFSTSFNRLRLRQPGSIDFDAARPGDSWLHDSTLQRLRQLCAPESQLEYLLALSRAGSEPALQQVWLQQPLVVEPRLREQFLIASPTPAYEQLLQTLPVSFVGSMARLESLVALMAQQAAAAFRQQQRPVPPWRSAEALLSKWSPAQVEQLTRQLNKLAVEQQTQQQQMQAWQQARAAAPREGEGERERLSPPWTAQPQQGLQEQQPCRAIAEMEQLQQEQRQHHHHWYQLQQQEREQGQDTAPAVGTAASSLSEVLKRQQPREGQGIWPPKDRDGEDSWRSGFEDLGTPPLSPTSPAGSGPAARNTSWPPLLASSEPAGPGTAASHLAPGLTSAFQHVASQLHVSHQVTGGRGAGSSSLAAPPALAVSPPPLPGRQQEQGPGPQVGLEQAGLAPGAVTSAALNQPAEDRLAPLPAATAWTSGTPPWLLPRPSPTASALNFSRQDSLELRQQLSHQRRHLRSALAAALQPPTARPLTTQPPPQPHTRPAAGRVQGRVDHPTSLDLCNGQPDVLSGHRQAAAGPAAACQAQAVPAAEEGSRQRAERDQCSQHGQQQQAPAQLHLTAAQQWQQRQVTSHWAAAGTQHWQQEEQQAATLRVPGGSPQAQPAAGTETLVSRQGVAPLPLAHPGGLHVKVVKWGMGLAKVPSAAEAEVAVGEQLIPHTLVSRGGL